MALATGQITIVDLTDLPSIQGYLISDKPKIQFLNKDGAYNPSWTSSSPLVISAEVYAVGSSANLVTDSRVVEILWYKDGLRLTASGGGITLIPSATGNKKHTSISISQNLLTTSSPTMKISAEIQYQHTSTVSPTPIKLEIDYGLSQQGATGQTGQTGSTGLSAVVPVLSNESVSLPANATGTVSSYAGATTELTVYEGSSLLAYDGIGTAAGKWKVTASGSNITPGAITASGSSAKMASPSSITSNTASITFTITGKRANGTSFQTITRVQNITKAIAGVKGIDAKSVDLSGPQVFKLDEAGAATPSSITLTAAAQNVSGSSYSWTFGLDGASPTTPLTTANFTGVTFSGSTVTITPTSTGWGSASSITVKVAIEGVYDTFTVVKVQDGATARTINLGTSSNTITFDLNNSPKPSSQVINLTASLANLGGSASFTATPYNEAGEAKTVITLGGTGNSKTLTSAQWVAAETAAKQEIVRVVVKATSGSLSDTVTIVKLRETGVFSGYLTNESILVPATKDGAVIGSLTTLTTGKFETFFGIQALENGTGVTFALDGAVSGGTATINAENGTYSVSAFSTNATNTVTARFKATHGLSGAILKKALTVTKSKVGATGENAVIPVVWAPDGEVFKSVAGATPADLTLRCDLYVGGTETDATSYQWFVQEGSADVGAGAGWALLTGSTSNTLTVTASMVPSIESFKCKAVYKTKSYFGTATLTDMTDPYQVTIISDNGRTFFNGGGASKILEAKVFQHGEEVDIDGTALKYSWTKHVGGSLVGGIISTDKTITVKASDVTTEAVFSCDIDTKL